MENLKGMGEIHRHSAKPQQDTPHLKPCKHFLVRILLHGITMAFIYDINSSSMNTDLRYIQILRTRIPLDLSLVLNFMARDGVPQGHCISRNNHI